MTETPCCEPMSPEKPATSVPWLPVPYKTARELHLFEGKGGAPGRGAGQHMGWEAVLDLAVARYWRKRVGL